MAIASMTTYHRITSNSIQALIKDIEEDVKVESTYIEDKKID